MSNNTLTHKGNGYFWVGDATAIERIENTADANVTISNGEIIIADAEDALVTVYSADGREVYKGTDSTIHVASGLYIVAVQQESTTTVTKVFVK